MTVAWSAQQLERLQAMGLNVLARPSTTASPLSEGTRPDGAAARSGPATPAGLARAARGVDLAALLAAHPVPRDVASRRAFWRLLRPLRKAARR